MSIISNNISRQSYPRLSWLMFHKIANMYRDIREKESEEATELIINLCANLNSSNTSLSSHNMDRYIWMKSISLFSRTCVASKLNPQVLFFRDHDSHFDHSVTHILRSHHTSPFILKAGDSTNDHPNDNWPNLKLE